MKLPYLLSLASFVPGVDRYLCSLWNLRNSVEWIDVQFEPHRYNNEIVLSYMQPSFHYLVRQPYPGHLYRFDYLPVNKLDPERWWIFTDTADVIFQASIPDLDELGKLIYVAPEGEIHRNNGFWVGVIERHPEFAPLLDKPIYNVGCWAMRGIKVLEWASYIREHRGPFGEDMACEQLLFNQWLSEQPQDIVGVHPTLMVTLYANLEKGYCKKENGLFVNEQGKPFSIVHGNGSLKEQL